MFILIRRSRASLIHVNTPDSSSAIVDPRERPCIVFDLFPGPREQA